MQQKIFFGLKQVCLFTSLTDLKRQVPVQCKNGNHGRARGQKKKTPVSICTSQGGEKIHTYNENKPLYNIFYRHDIAEISLFIF